MTGCMLSSANATRMSNQLIQHAKRYDTERLFVDSTHTAKVPTYNSLTACGSSFIDKSLETLKH